MKQLGLMTLIIIGAGTLQAEITPLKQIVPQGKWEPSELGTQSVEGDVAGEGGRKIPKNAFDFPIRKGNEGGQ